MFEQVGYAGRGCDDQERIDAELAVARVGVVGISGDDYPYAVPVNFVWAGGAFYFHGMGSGKKFRLLASAPKVSFTVVHEHGTVLDGAPCHVDTSYFSVMAFGIAETVTDPAEGADALNLLLAKYAPEFFSRGVGAKLVERYRSSTDGNPVAVYRIRPEHLTAKENSPDGLERRGDFLLAPPGLRAEAEPADDPA